MSIAKFQAGDIVKLKSGGPRMTVHQYKLNPMTGQPIPTVIICHWFDENNEINEAQFHPDELEKQD